MRLSGAHIAGGWIILLFLAGPAGAGKVRVSTSLQTRIVEQGKYFWLPTHKMMMLELKGPTHLGFRLREVLAPGRAPDPVDLTVVRDNSEQGTVRFQVSRDSQHSQYSAEVLIRIVVPSGKHSYTVLVSGPKNGVLLMPFAGAISPTRTAIEATPAADKVLIAKKPKPRRRRQPVKPSPPAQPQLDLLAAVEQEAPVALEPRSLVIKHQPSARPLYFGPGAKTSGAISGALLLGAAAMSITGRVQLDRARSEPVQIVAGTHFDRAERSEQAATAMYSLAAGALVVAVICYLVEEPDSVDRTESELALGRY